MSRGHNKMSWQTAEAIAQYQHAIELNPENASAHAMLAETYHEAGYFDEAIHAYRTAISLSPHGPHATKWKSSLRKTLDAQAGVDRHNFTVCHHCHADMPTDAKVCSRCGTRLQMGFVEWFCQPQVFKDVGRQTAVVTSIAVVLLTIFSALPLEWKACILCATVIVGGYYALRGIGG